MGRMQRTKGAQYERDLANYLTAHGITAKRGIGQARSASEVPDVDVEDLWIEAKRHKRTNPRAALAQAIEASAGTNRVPVAVCRDNGTNEDDALVAMRLVDWMAMLAQCDDVLHLYVRERERRRIEADAARDNARAKRLTKKEDSR